MPKPAGMRRTIIWALIALVSFIMSLAMPYAEGLSNAWWMIPPLFPADMLPPLVLLISSAVLLFHCIRSIIARRHVVATAVIFLSSAVLLGARCTVPPAVLFECGFHRYAKTVLTADEWRGVARRAQQLLQPEGRLPGPMKNLWNEKKHRPLWSALAASTQIEKLDPSLMIFVAPESTEVVWGGALVGHRAVIIFTDRNGRRQYSNRPQDMLIAEDIVTSISSD